MTPDVGRVLLSAVDALESLGLRYAIVGGLAVGAWGVNRSTKDVDVYADLPAGSRAPLQRALEEQGFSVPAMDGELERFGVFRSRAGSGVFLDIFGAVGPLGEAILARRRSILLAGRSLWFIAPEELAVLKAFSERERDFEDLVNLSSVMGAKLDVAYVLDWAKQLDRSIGGDDVSDRVTRALVAAERKAKPGGRRRRPRR